MRFCSHFILPKCMYILFDVHFFPSRISYIHYMNIYYVYMNEWMNIVMYRSDSLYKASFKSLETTLFFHQAAHFWSIYMHMYIFLHSSLSLILCSAVLCSADWTWKHNVHLCNMYLHSQYQVSVSVPIAQLSIVCRVV